MKVLSSAIENNLLTAELRIEYEDFEKALKDAYLDNTDKYVVPGYAPGLAPRSEIERLYGDTALFDEAIDLCVPKLYRQFIDESGIRTVGSPKLISVTWLTGGGANFTVECNVFPKVVLGEYKGMAVPVKRSENPSEFEAKALVAACRNMKAEVPAGMKDQKLQAMLAGEKMRVAGDPIYNVLADFAAVLKDAYAATEVSRSPAQINSEALDVLLLTMSRDNESVSAEKFKSLIASLVENYRFLPHDFDETLDELMKRRAEKKRLMSDDEKIEDAFQAYLGSLNQTEELWLKSNRERAADAARFDLLLGAVAEREGMTVTRDELMETYEMIAKQTGLDLDEVIAGIEEQPIREQLLRDKARELIVSTAVEMESSAADKGCEQV